MRVRLLVGTMMWCLMNGAAWADEGKQAPPMQCGTFEYPYEAAMYGLEGATTVEYSVAADGKMTDFSVKRSSGWRVLDEATVDNLAGCRMTLAPATAAPDKRQVIQYVWSLDVAPSRQGLVPGSCAVSDRFAGFRALDTRPSGADGILVRAMIRANGTPQFVAAERGDTPADLAVLAKDYLRSCRFLLPPGERLPNDDAIFGRVLLK